MRTFVLSKISDLIQMCDGGIDFKNGVERLEDLSDEQLVYLFTRLYISIGLYLEETWTSQKGSLHMIIQNDDGKSVAHVELEANDEKIHSQNIAELIMHPYSSIG